MEHKLVKVFEEENNFNNAAIVLSLDIDEVTFMYHHEINKKLINSCKEVIKKYRKKISVNFVLIKDEKVEIKKYLDKETVIDISACKYLTACLFEEAIKQNLNVIYYDEEECVIKWYNDRAKKIADIFKLNVNDIIKLGGGKITKKQMHENININDTETTTAIKKTVEANFYKYSGFISFVQRLNSYIAHRKTKDLTYSISKEIKYKIQTDEAYKRIKDFGLFRLTDTNLIFMNRDIESLFRVSGAFLENYLYIILTESKKFDEIEMSSVIDFTTYYEGFPIICEIDMLVTKNNRLLFISCKSNKVDNSALFEIKVHNYILGNKLSSAVMCTLDDLNKTSPSTYLKAKELKIGIVDRTAFINHSVPSTLLSIMFDTYKYEKV